MIAYWEKPQSRWCEKIVVVIGHLVQLIEFFFVGYITTLQRVAGLSPVMPTEDLWSELTSP